MSLVNSKAMVETERVERNLTVKILIESQSYRSEGTLAWTIGDLVYPSTRLTRFTASLQATGSER